MTQQTHFERLAGREATARERARITPTINDHEHDHDHTDTFPILTDVDVAPTPVSDRAPAEWQVGDTVAGRFVLRERCGKRRYGPVFKALDRALSEPALGVEHYVMLEELPPWIAERTTFIERLEQLRLYPQSWSHPNIAKVLEFGRDGAKYFFCEQLLEGASLRVVLDASAPEALEEHEVLGILRYVGDALSYTHAKGIVHGDLRLDNVFVTEAYEVKLTGLLPSSEPRPAPVFVEDPSTGGRPHPSDDVYGLACLAYELFTRRHPYDGKTPLEALRAGLTAHAALNLSLPRWEALARGLALRRERRTATIAEFLLGLGMTGAETLRPAPKTAEAPAPKSAETTAPPREAAPAETPWPEITSPEPPRRAPRVAASLAAAPPAAEAFATARPARFAEIYPEPTARLVRHRHRRRRASPVRAVLGVVLAAGFATFAYLDHASLRDRAAGLMELAAALVRPPNAPNVAVPAGTTPRTAPPAASTPVATTRAASVPVATAPGEPEPAVTEPLPVAPPETEAPPPAEPAIEAAPPAVAAVPAASAPGFAFAERTLTVNERDGSARVLIRRTGSLAEEASVVWWTTDGTAVADEDYAVLGARVLRFAAGEDIQVLYIPLIVDSLREPRESFVVNLRSDRAGGAATQLEVVVVDDGR